MAKEPKKTEFTGLAWSVEDVGGNEARCTELRIEGGVVVEKTLYPSNLKIIVLEQIVSMMGEKITA